MFEFNRDVKTRDEIIFGKYEEEKYMGGTRRFEGMDLDTVKKLLEMKFMDPDEAQNFSPTIQELVDFAELYEGYTFGGYTVSIDRCDYRVSLESISKGFTADVDEVKEFSNKFHAADEFDCVPSLYAWWD